MKKEKERKWNNQHLNGRIRGGEKKSNKRSQSNDWKSQRSFELDRTRKWRPSLPHDDSRWFLFLLFFSRPLKAVSLIGRRRSSYRLISVPSQRHTKVIVAGTRIAFPFLPNERTKEREKETGKQPNRNAICVACVKTRTFSGPIADGEPDGA